LISGNDCPVVEMTQTGFEFRIAARAQILDAAAVTVPAFALFDGEGDLWPVAGIAGLRGDGAMMI
jgi:hypothetical protein